MYNDNKHDNINYYYCYYYFHKVRNAGQRAKGVAGREGRLRGRGAVRPRDGGHQGEPLV